MRAKTPYRKDKKRWGRGPGSGRGKTSTRGHKGGGARSGWRRRAGYEGGQNPYYRRFPKRGFVHAVKKVYDVINVGTLALWNEGTINLDTFRSRGLLKSKHVGIKVLAKGTLTKPLVVEAHAFSRAAREQIEKAGGKAVAVSDNRAEAA